MANVFQKAKAKSGTKTAKKSEKILVHVKGEEFKKNLKTVALNDKKIKELKSELDSAKSSLLETAKEEYAKLYTKEKKNVGSFLIKSDGDGSFLFTPTKKYLKLDEDRSKYIKKVYGEDYISEETSYSFDNKILEKHMDKIGEMLAEADFLTDEEKEDLIVANTSYTIKKDVLDDFYNIKSEKEIDIEDCIEDFSPVFQIKTPKEPKE